MRRHQVKRRNKQESLFDLEIHPEVKIGIFAVILLLTAILGVLSFWGWAGQIGRIFNGALAVVFGYDRLIFPALLGVSGVLLLKPSLRPKLRQWIGIAFFILSLNGLIHLLTFDYMESWRGAALGQGGGYAGLALSYPLDRGLGLLGATLALAAFLIVSLMLVSRSFVLRILLFLEMLLSGAIKIFVMALNKLRAGFKKTETSSQNLFLTKPISDSPEENKISVKEETAERDSDDALDLISIKTKKIKKFISPLPIDLLTVKSGKPNAGDIKTNELIIQKTLENFGIEVEMGEVSVGPTVAQYTLKPAEGVKLARITALSNDLALALAAHPIRIEAPIPGKSLVGIEVPNQQISRVFLREIFEGDEWKKSTGALTIALGKDVAGKAWCADLSRMPHLLIAGATGSGKTVSLNSIIVSLLYRNQPDNLKFILIDPKRVELPIYNGIPHLLTPVITEVAKVVNALRWTIGEMEKRFDALARTSKRDIESYNKIAPERMPYIVVVIDELADLMVAAASEIEASIIRLAQMSRAVGIHLCIATQRPSVDIITGLIKANITSRAAFAVASQTDSRTILDIGGAEKLLGRGDMLFASAELSKPRRLQGAYVSDEEINRITEFLRKQGEEAEYNESITEKRSVAIGGISFDDDDDSLMGEAKDTVLRAGKASASLLQRRLKIGYARAARLLDIMEERGIIGPADGAKPREVLISFDNNDSMSEERKLGDFNNI